MLAVARTRGFSPRFVMFDSWYGSIGNLKRLRELQRHWLTRLKKNRLVNSDWSYNRQIHEIEIRPSGRVVHLKEYGMIKVFCIIPPDDEKDFWATDVLDLEEKKFNLNLHEDLQKLNNITGVSSNFVESNDARHEVLLRDEHISLWQYEHFCDLRWHVSLRALPGSN
jgi:hypothetical protein